MAGKWLCHAPPSLQKYQVRSGSPNLWSRACGHSTGDRLLPG
ncbi:hypothetical protein CCACVL1_11861 [Corchorus capsularis]|uniref:Uncharacterized protein n=1 Tax=Corchorus capsularis TaxID=210143 RepID=A0A1R3IJ47_COCAP|nr:hypothetical protein CCACVL1_11861 [Corchorus capsularis]